MNWLIDKATVICVGKMYWFGIFQILVLYFQTVKWDWTELAQDRATVNCGQDALVWDGPNPVIVLSNGKMALECTGSLRGNCNLCMQAVLVWDVPDPGIVLSDGKMGLE